MIQLPITRSQKIYYGYHGAPYEKHPVIRIAGKYLAKMDYRIGAEVDILVEADRIVITKRKQAHVAPSETEPGAAEEQPVRDNLV